MYVKKFDPNGNPIDEAIDGYKVELVDISVPNEIDVPVPAGAYSIVLKDANVGFKMNVNDLGYFTSFAGDMMGPFRFGIKSVKIQTLQTSTKPIEIMFLY